MKTKKEKDWFKIKAYPHIGLPLSYNDRHKWIEKYVTSPEKIACHSFLPFIHKTSKVKKFRKVYSDRDGKVHNEYKKDSHVLRKPDEKKRELFYASHLDSLIFSYYAKELSEKYEAKLKSADYNLDDVVNAYRSIPVNPRKKDSANKCNIDFANDVFEYVLNYKQDNFYVIAFDISSFFDNLNHKKLLKIWCEIIGEEERLPPDHFNVFKNITRFSHVDIVDIFEEFKDRIYTRKFDAAGKPLPIRQKKVDKIRYMRNQNAIAFCTKEEFLNLKGRLLQSNKAKLKDGKIVPRDFGIPQGSPISSILANIYLLHFDKAVNKFISVNGGIYKRYSDDIVVVCPVKVKETLTEIVYREITNFRLEIQKKKTQIFEFKRDHDRLICGQEFDGVTNWDKNFIYLGFEFDGNHVFLKSASLAGYYRKMKRAVRRAKHYSTRKFSPTSGIIFKRRLFKKFSYKGAKRTRKYIWNDVEKRFIKSDSYNWGNFLSYAYKASNIMIKNKIKQQTKRHWNILNQLIK